MANSAITLAVLSVYLLCGVHWTSATPSPNTLAASGLSVRAIAGDTYLDQVMDNSPWKLQEHNKTLLLYTCNRVAYHDLLNATRESGSLNITTNETARLMSASMNILCKIVLQNENDCDAHVEEFLSQARLHCPAILLSQRDIWASKIGAEFFQTDIRTEPQRYIMGSSCE